MMRRLLNAVAWAAAVSPLIAMLYAPQLYRIIFN